jgi:tetratricopeptide (TPR) repeat protein
MAVGKVITLWKDGGTGNSRAPDLRELRLSTGMEAPEFASAIGEEAGEPVPTFVYLAYEGDEPPPPSIVAAAQRVAARRRQRSSSTRPYAFLREIPALAATVTTSDFAEVDPAVRAAKLSSTFLEWAETTKIGSVELEQMASEAKAIVDAYDRGSPEMLVTDTALLRERIIAILRGHHHPGMARDLYLLTGQLTALLAWIAGDMGQPRFADQHGAAAWICADLADHDGLRASVLATRSKTAFWQGRYRESVQLAHQGFKYPAPGQTRVLLACREASAWAQLGAAKAAREALRRGEEALAHLDEADDLGSIFTSGPARHANYTSLVELRLGDPDRALREAEKALHLFDHDPVHHYGTHAQVLITKVAAQLAVGDTDAAISTLGELLRIPPDQRLDTLVRRLTAARPLAGSRSKEALHVIDEFCTETVAPAAETERRRAGPTLAPKMTEMRMVNHWSDAGASPGRAFYTWMLTFEDAPDVGQLPAHYAPALAGLPVDISPAQSLHMTLQRVGFEEAKPEDIARIAERAQLRCSTLTPFAFTLDKVIVVREAVIMLAVPAGPLAALRAALRHAIADVWGKDAVPENESVPNAPDGFVPHVTLAYSNAEGPGAPVIAAVRAVQRRTVTVTVDSASLLLVDGRAGVYHWQHIASARLR